MQKILPQLQMESDESCTGEDLLILPCRHDIHEYQQLNTGLPLELVHKQLIMKWPQPNEFENSFQQQFPSAHFEF
jgi:hypothetical protein